LTAAEFTVAILVGGAGTRLRAVVRDRPKPLAPVCGRPFLAYLLNQVAALRPRRIVLCTGYGAEQVRDAIGGSWQGIEVGYAREESPLGTGGALANARPVLGPGSVLAMNGDSYCDTSLDAFQSAHFDSRAETTLLLVRMLDVARYGAVSLDAGNRITAFHEKGARAAGWINAGVYMISPARLAEIPVGRAVSLEGEMFPLWIQSGLYGHPCEGRFIDIGIPEDFRRAQEFFDGQPDSPKPF